MNSRRRIAFFFFTRTRYICKHEVFALYLQEQQPHNICGPWKLNDTRADVFDKVTAGRAGGDRYLSITVDCFFLNVVNILMQNQPNYIKQACNNSTVHWQVYQCLECIYIILQQHMPQLSSSFKMSMTFIS